jgi:hypothetical protein
MLVLLHLIADTFAQTEWMIEWKGVRIFPLTLHTFFYSIFLLPVGFTFAIINGILHWFIDYFSSKRIEKLWRLGDRKKTFIATAIDHCVHISTLVVTYAILF